MDCRRADWGGGGAQASPERTHLVSASRLDSARAVETPMDLSRLEKIIEDDSEEFHNTKVTPRETVVVLGGFVSGDLLRRLVAAIEFDPLPEEEAPSDEDLLADGLLDAARRGVPLVVDLPGFWVEDFAFDEPDAMLLVIEAGTTGVNGEGICRSARRVRLSHPGLAAPLSPEHHGFIPWREFLSADGSGHTEAARAFSVPAAAFGSTPLPPVVLLPSFKKADAARRSGSPVVSSMNDSKRSSATRDSARRMPPPTDRSFRHQVPRDPSRRRMPRPPASGAWKSPPGCGTSRRRDGGLRAVRSCPEAIGSQSYRQFWQTPTP